MTDQELKDLVASLAISSAKTDEQLAKTEKQSAKGIAELREMLAKTDKQSAKGIAELREMFAKTDKQSAKGIAELREMLAKTDKQSAKGIAELREMFAKTDAKFAKTDAQFADTDKKFKEMGIYAKNLNQHVDGISKSNGQMAQEFFFSSLSKKLIFGSIKFDIIDQNLFRQFNGTDHEIDIFLENGNILGIVEVKNKVKEDSLVQLSKTIANFPKFYPHLKSIKIMGGIAGKIFPQHLKIKALKQGFVVLTQQGNHIEQRLPNKQ